LFFYLINNSKTILEGPIKTIKEQYTDNTYQIIISEGELLENSYFTITDKKENDYTICLKKGVGQKEAIKEIIKDVEVLSFNKKIPTMEEIFIKAVNNA
jgi:ABC-2 type transport system ATP-binding protein